MAALNRKYLLRLFAQATLLSFVCNPSVNKSHNEPDTAGSSDCPQPGELFSCDIVNQQ